MVQGPTRRRRVLATGLAAAAVSAFAAGMLVAAGPAEREPSASRLGNAQLAGQRVIAGFAGENPPSRLKQLVRRGRVAGVILFSNNFDGPGEARELIRDLQSIPRPDRVPQPLLIMLDQEGGLVKRLPGPPSYSAEEMGRLGRETSRRQGGATGRYLSDVGVNVDLAPVLDVARPGGVIDQQDRAFGHRRGRVSDTANAFAKGLLNHDVVATAKHFPGLGAAYTDTDLAPEQIDRSRDKLRTVDEYPYRRFKRIGGPMVMLSMAVYPAFDERPAGLSHALATDELRGRLGFEGVSITDALGTPSARAVGGPAKLARKTARAGTDLALDTDLDDAIRGGRALRDALREGRIGRAKFLRSAQRVLDLREQLGG